MREAARAAAVSLGTAQAPTHSDTKTCVLPISRPASKHRPMRSVCSPPERRRNEDVSRRIPCEENKSCQKLIQARRDGHSAKRSLPSAR